MSFSSHVNYKNPVKVGNKKIKKKRSNVKEDEIVQMGRFNVNLKKIGMESSTTAVCKILGKH